MMLLNFESHGSSPNNKAVLHYSVEAAPRKSEFWSMCTPIMSITKIIIMKYVVQGPEPLSLTHTS